MEKYDNINDYVKAWEYGHDKPIPLGYANAWVRIKEVHVIPSDRHVPKIHRGKILDRNHWKILLNADPTEFEYRGVSTSVEVYENYESLGYPGYYRVHMSTIDDSSMSLWLNREEITNSMHLGIRQYFLKKKIVKSCHYTYHDLAMILGLPRSDDYPFDLYLDMDKFKEIEAHPMVHSLDFN